MRKALRILKRAWAQEQHPLLQETLNDIAKQEAPEKQEKIRAMLDGIAQDGHWICKTCGHRGDAWELHCGECGSLGSEEWK